MRTEMSSRAERRDMTGKATSTKKTRMASVMARVARRVQMSQRGMWASRLGSRAYHTRKVCRDG